MDLEQKAIERLKLAAQMSERYYNKPLLLAYSGGKDSDVCTELARRAGIRFEVEHSLTTADAPETVRHVRDKFYSLELEGIHCEIISPRYKGEPVSMWTLIPQKLMPPTRLVRYCCQVLKESTTENRAIVTGVRWAESTSRATTRGAMEKHGKTVATKLIFDDGDEGERQMVEHCKLKAKIIHNPIIEWTNADVWTFLHEAGIKTNPLYNCFNRVGCIGCPLAGSGRYDEFRLYPAYEKLYRKAFESMLEARKQAGKPTTFKNADAVFRWWMEDTNLDGQLSLFGGEIGG